jgi:DNA-binding NarL/FixJ family response regulator
MSSGFADWSDGIALFAPSLGGASSPTPRRPGLSEQERAVLLGYVSGLTLAAAAHRAGVRAGTAKVYLDRVKEKYARAGRPARTKIDLVRRALEDGLL